MQDSIATNRTRIRRNNIEIAQFKNSVYWCAQEIDDFENLQRIVNKNLYPYVRTQDPKAVEINADIKKEQENQRRYLETAKATLKKRLDKENEVHKTQMSKAMRENLDLITDIRRLRTRIEGLRDVEKDKKNRAKMIANRSNLVDREKGSTLTSDAAQQEQIE